ncbi:subtilisin-like protein [Lactarius psammicola]|nr:subtilisin-like protein [Lactarius psammicola]
MRYHLLFVLSALSAVLPADLTTPPAPLWGDIRVMHTWNSVPANWECLGPPPAGTTIDLYIALQPHRENALIDALHEVAELVAPHQDTLELVHSWLEHHGVPSSSISTSLGGGWLTITGIPVSQADELLSASYQLYRHTGTNETEVILRTVGYALPAELHTHVQTVAPTTHFASPRTPHSRSSEEAEVMANATSGEPVRALSRRDYPPVRPSTLRSLYRTEAYVPAAVGLNAIGILGLQNEYPSQADLTQFMELHREDAVSATFRYVLINGGGWDPSNPGTEASIDIQYAEAMSFPTPHIFFSTGGQYRWSGGIGLPGPGDAYLEWFKFLLTRPYLPPTITISYANPEPAFPPAYAIAVCHLFAALGLRGVSVLVSSGDHGVGLGDCKDSSGNVQFIPMFPASCPWVTSVGGTMQLDPEVVMPLSGGGFSRLFPRPNYQNGAVLTFLQRLGDQYAGFYNPWGRGIPDIAAQAHRYSFVQGAEWYFASGTSTSTPTVAGIVSLLNDYLISTGRRPLGFLNLWLYDRGLAGLNDIMSGTNPGCETDGFLAIADWDPATGLGTPDFVRLQLVLDYLV